MTLLCATDLSDHARHAARVAAALAKGRGSRVMLLHVVDHVGAEQTVANAALMEPIRHQVEALASDLRAEFGVDVDVSVIAGFADEAVVAQAAHHQVELVVVGSLGRRKEGRWLLGSVAERIAQSCSRPVLVVRDAARLLMTDRPVRALVAIETPSSATLPAQHATSASALRVAASLRQSMPTTLTIASIVWPQREHSRLGIKTGMPLDGLNPEVEGPLRRDLEVFARAQPGVVDDHTRLVLKPGWGRTDSHVIQLAIDEDQDVIVVGSHQRSGLARLWSGSVSRGVLSDAPTNVLCVPATSVTTTLAPAPRPRNIVVPLDFSPLGDRAIAVAYGIVGEGGQVHLLHVIGAGDDQGAAEGHLRARQMQGAAATSFEVTTSDDVAGAVCAAAARIGADAICLATHGRSDVGKALLGSQAEAIVRRAGRPVVLVPPAES